MPTEEIVVLANSRKLNGRCVAGISTRSGKWVRPVSDLPRGELKPYHYEIGNRSPEVLDVVRFGFEKNVADPAQPENVLLDDEDWQLAGRVDPSKAYAQLQAHLSTDSVLLGSNDRYMEESVAEAGVEASLALVEPDGELEFIVRDFNGTRRPRVVFQLGAEQYNLPLTDPSSGSCVKAAGLGRHGLADVGLPTGGHALLTVSLGEPFEGRRWKLVAALIHLP